MPWKCLHIVSLTITISYLSSVPLGEEFESSCVSWHLLGWYFSVKVVVALGDAVQLLWLVTTWSAFSKVRPSKLTIFTT